MGLTNPPQNGTQSGSCATGRLYWCSRCLRCACNYRSLGHGCGGVHGHPGRAGFRFGGGGPAKRIGWVGSSGVRLEKYAEQRWRCPLSQETFVENDGVLTQFSQRTELVVVSYIPAAKPLIGDEEREAVDRVLASGGITRGPKWLLSRPSSARS